MSGNVLLGSSTLHQVGLSFSADLTGYDYINSNANSVSMKFGSLSRAHIYVFPEYIFQLYKSLISPCMERRRHVWAGASIDVPFLLDKVQRRVVNIIGPSLTLNLQPLSST